MSKSSGLGDKLYVGGYDLSGDVGAVTAIRSSRALLDVTPIEKSAPERIYGLRDGELSFNTFFDDAAGQEHAALSGLPTTDRVVQYFRGVVLGGEVAALIGKQVNYDWTRSADGGLLGTVQALSNGFGLEWGRSLTAGKRTDGAPANGAGIEHAGGSTSFGLSAYLQVFAFDGTNVTVKLQESSDDAVGDPYADVTGGGFAAVTVAPAQQRIETALNLTVEGWLRVVTTGVFNSVTFAVSVVRHLGAI